MKKIAFFLIILIVLAGCSSKPSDSEIERLVFGDDDTEIMKYEEFTKTDGFQKDDKTYIADVEYSIVFKMSRKEVEELLSKDHDLLGVVFNIGLLWTFGDYDKGSTYRVAKKVTLIKKESGWSIENIEDQGMQRITTKAEEEAKAWRAKEEEAAKALRAKEEAKQRKQQAEKEETKRQAETAQRKRLAEEEEARRQAEAAARIKQAEEEEAKRQAEAKIRALDDEDWAKAQGIGTEESYRAYLKQPHHVRHATEARNLLARAALDRAQSVGTAEAYRRFLLEFSDSEPAMTARDRIDEILWADANAKYSVSSYREYLSAYPNGKFSEPAKIQIDEMSWAEAKRNGNEESIRSYLLSFPSGRHVKDAQNEIEQIKIRIDEMKWTEAKRDGNEKAIQSYLSSFPSGRYVKEAELSLESVAWSRVKQENIASKYLSYAQQYPKGQYIYDCRQAAILAALREHPPNAKTVDIIGNTPWNGVRVTDITPNVITMLVQLGYKQSVNGGSVIVTEILPEHANGCKLYIQPGDIIEESDNTPISGTTQFYESTKLRELSWRPANQTNKWQVKYIRVRILEANNMEVTAGTVYK